MSFNLLPVVGGVLGNLLLPGFGGAALGSALGSLAGGERDPMKLLASGAMGGLGGSLAGSIGQFGAPAASAAQGVTQGAGAMAPAAAWSAAANPAAQTALQGAGTGAGGGFMAGLGRMANAPSEAAKYLLTGPNAMKVGGLMMTAPLALTPPYEAPKEKRYGSQDIGVHRTYANVSDMSNIPLGSRNPTYLYFEPDSTIPRRYYARGGPVSSLAQFGHGTSDTVPATINGVQPARLSPGEYVVPARAVSELGNGDTEAGVAKLDRWVADLAGGRPGRKVNHKMPR